MNELDVLNRFRDDVPEPSTDPWLRARAAIEAVRAETSEPPAPLAPPRRGFPRSRRSLAVVSIGIAVTGAAVGVGLLLSTRVTEHRLLEPVRAVEPRSGLRRP
jgi:hypothetical protein